MCRGLPRCTSGFDETRPCLQGATLTAWELARRRRPLHPVVDSAGGHLMQRGGSRPRARRVRIAWPPRRRREQDRDLSESVAARASGSRPLSRRLHRRSTGVCAPACGIPIEAREADAGHPRGAATKTAHKTEHRARSDARPGNLAFDVTPARLVNGLVTERGIAPASAEGLARLFPEMARRAAG